MTIINLLITVVYGVKYVSVTSDSVPSF